MYFELEFAIANIGHGGYPQIQRLELEPGRTVHDKDYIWQVPYNDLPGSNSSL